jgi:alpha-beta hydrolase superfamily lysophospholipase
LPEGLRHSEWRELRLPKRRKTPTNPASDKLWGNALPVLSLVHGSSTSSRSSFDLTVPGHGEYSLMDKFAGFGFDVWTMDFEGCGRSDSTEGHSDIASGVEDLKAATEVVARETGQARFHFFVESSGALRAGAMARAPLPTQDSVLRRMIMHGEFDGIATEEDLLDFYKKLS